MRKFSMKEVKFYIEALKSFKEAFTNQEPKKIINNNYNYNNNKHILNARETRRKNLPMDLIDYKKGIWHGSTKCTKHQNGIFKRDALSL